jgi:hypothetical protein
MLEIRKNQRQMNVTSAPLAKQATAFKLALFPFVCKDILFRVVFESTYHFGIFYEYFTKLRSQRQMGLTPDHTLSSQLHFEASQKIHQKSGMFILSALLASALTHPLDVINTRLICQQKDVYSGVIDCWKTIVREEGRKKLFFSGLGPRNGFIFLQGSLMMILSPRILPVIEQAYSLENMIN